VATPRRQTGGFWPRVDVTETTDEIKVTAVIPGGEPRDIEVSMQDALLVLKGEKKYEREEKEKGHYRMECSYGSNRKGKPNSSRACCD
jgi:HSP20 family protein